MASPASPKANAATRTDLRRLILLLWAGREVLPTSPEYHRLAPTGLAQGFAEQVSGGRSQASDVNRQLAPKSLRPETCNLRPYFILCAIVIVYPSSSSKANSRMP